MHCCSECFNDSEIKAIIENPISQKGKCDYCNSTNGILYEINEHSELSGLLSSILDVYTPSCDLSSDFPNENTALLKNALKNDWKIFSDRISPDNACKLMKDLCPDYYVNQPELFDSKIVIKEKFNEVYMEEHSILKNFNWDDFSIGIKEKNRFHSNYFNEEKLNIFLRCARKGHKKGEIFYRARICHDKKGYDIQNMGMPPKGTAKAGRVNPEGISMFYLSDSEKTTLHEVRAGLYDYVSIAKFELQQNTEVFNLSQLLNISPFVGVEQGFDLLEYAVNIQHLKTIRDEMRKPLRNGNVLDYLPTQYISDFIKSRGYSGIEFSSTMNKDGINLAFFDDEIFKCLDVKKYDIESIDYDFSEI